MNLSEYLLHDTVLVMYENKLYCQFEIYSLPIESDALSFFLFSSAR